MRDKHYLVWMQTMGKWEAQIWDQDAKDTITKFDPKGKYHFTELQDGEHLELDFLIARYPHPPNKP